VPAGERAPADVYAVAARRAIYRELAARAAVALRDGAVVVDATFGDRAARDAFFAAMQAHGDVLLGIRCRAADATLARRAADRAAGGGAVSDAGPAEVARLAVQFTAIEEISADRLLDLETDRDPAELVDAVAGWLDRRLSRG
jgi:predicted kinase